MLTKKTAGIKMCNGVIACSIALILIKAITITKCHAVAHMHGKGESDEIGPQFLAKLSNTTVPLGRDISFTCVVDNLGHYRHNNKILNFDDGNLVAECRSRNINIGNCKTTVGATFCKELQNGTCAQQIISGAFAHCSTLPGQLDPVTIVDYGTLIVNDANVTITDNQGKDQKVSGTYLVTYTEKVALNGTWYINQLGNSDKKPAVSVIAVVNVTAHQNRLSLPLLHELSLRNLHHIGTLREKLTLGSLLSNSLAILAGFLLCSTIWLSYHHLKTRGHTKPGDNSDVEQVGHRDGDLLKGGEVNTSSSHGVKLLNCRPYPVVCTRTKQTADRVLQVHLPRARTDWPDAELLTWPSASSSAADQRPGVEPGPNS
ncbi:uncharacterized protein LOC116800539 isoform X6 [Drosophila sechellia]|uniref:uncharacterized protein LOC116800539 isoform X6 n=1 Tax=Drosophila sechellia TaxID=7238 RepID=UPI0013DDA9EE|nr:uncharacterized protein LOC116800539 isoform X6 [Drosophila sechellia]